MLFFSLWDTCGSAFGGLRHEKIFIKEILEKRKRRDYRILSVLPVIIFLLVMLISIAQMGSIKERMEYTTYVAGRAAVVQKDFSSARKAAYETAQRDLLNFSNTFEPGSLKVTLRIIKKTGSSTSNKDWKKGNYLSCTISVNTKTLSPLINGKKSCTLTMMIERPTDDLDSILP